MSLRESRLVARATSTVAALLACVAAAAVAIVPPAFAEAPTPSRADDAKWTVQPSSPKGPSPNRNHFLYDLSPGEKILDYVGISNLGTQPTTFQVYATDAFTASDGAFALLPASRPPTDSGTWVVLQKKEYTVPPGKRLDIPFQLNVPANAPPGDHAGGIIASVQVQETTKDGQQIFVDRRVAARVYLRVHGPLAPAVEVTALDVKYANPFIPFGGGDLAVTYRVANTGNVRVSGKARVQVKGPLGVRVGSSEMIDIPELLPDSEIRRTVTIPGLFPAGWLSASLAVNTVADGDSVRPATRSASVAAVPWLLVGVLVVIIALVILLWIRRRRARAAELLPPLDEPIAAGSR